MPNLECISVSRWEKKNQKIQCLQLMFLGWKLCQGNVQVYQFWNDFAFFTMTLLDMKLYYKLHWNAVKDSNYDNGSRFHVFHDSATKRFIRSQIMATSFLLAILFHGAMLPEIKKIGDKREHLPRCICHLCIWIGGSLWYSVKHSGLSCANYYQINCDADPGIPNSAQLLKLSVGANSNVIISNVQDA